MNISRCFECGQELEVAIYANGRPYFPTHYVYKDLYGNLNVPLAKVSLCVTSMGEVMRGEMPLFIGGFNLFGVDVDATF